jgi:hypothetical protein
MGASIAMPILRGFGQGTREVFGVVEVAAKSQHLDFTQLMGQLCLSLSRFGMHSEDITRVGGLELYRIAVRFPM